MKVKPNILLLTSLEDLSCDFLILELKNKGANYFRFNSECVSEYEFEWGIDNELTIKHNDTIYSLSNLNSIYFRRRPTIYPSFSSSEFNSFIKREWTHFIEGVLFSSNAYWVNPYYNTIRAERKLYQLSLAKRIGFSIPNTIVSNTSNEIVQFVKRNGECIIKPISHGLIFDEDKSYSFYTNSVNVDDFSVPTTVYESPVLVQERISNDFDIRVTVIGNKIFAVKIKKSNQEEVDWRKPEIDKKYQQINLPKEIDEKIFKLNQSLELSYSAIDLIYDEQGRYIFLEINPAGEWAWLELELGLPIRKEIVNVLINGK